MKEHQKHYRKRDFYVSYDDDKIGSILLTLAGERERERPSRDETLYFIATDFMIKNDIDMSSFAVSLVFNSFYFIRYRFSNVVMTIMECSFRHRIIL